MRIARTLIVLILSSVVGLLGAERDLFIGTWKLNWDKSHSSDERPKSAIRIYRKSGKGVRVSEMWVRQDGKHTRVDYVAAYDGKDYPVRTAKGETVAFTRPDPNTVVGASKTNGNIAYTFKRVVSEAGKMLTIQITSTNVAGETSTQVLVYDRLK